MISCVSHVHACALLYVYVQGHTRQGACVKARGQALSLREELLEAP